MAIIKGTLKADILTGTAQADQFHINHAGDVIIGGNSQDQVLSTLASYELPPGLGSLVLGSGADVGIGNAGANMIGGNQRNNLLDGGAGMDELTGGGGADVFRFSHAGQAHADFVTDFQVGIDKIAIHGAAFGIAAGTAVGYELNRQATGAGPTFLRYGSQGTAQAVYFDRDGVGGAAAQMICTLQAFAGATSAADFAVI
jgi:Ca2+-binding RTX toxin-like protein